MSVLDKMEKAMEKKEEMVVDNTPEEEKKSTRSYTRRVQPKPVKLVIPDHIKTLFSNLDKSINSVWGMQSSGKIKWDAKFSMWVVFKEYFEELMSNE